jgi:hypothetical protein
MAILPMKFMGFGAMDGHFAYEFIGFGKKQYV